VSFGLTKDYIEFVYAELEAMPCARPTLDEYDRIAYAKRLACITEQGHFNQTIVALRDKGGYRPSPSDFGDLVRRACGITEIDDLPPAQRAIYRNVITRAAEEKRFEEEQAQIASGASVSARDRAKALIASLAARTGTGITGDRRYSYGPEEWRGTDPDPLQGVPGDDQADFLTEATDLLRSLVRQPHPGAIRQLAGKLHHDRTGALRDVSERRRQFAAVMGGSK
jgi:hypothetical protein